MLLNIILGLAQISLANSNYHFQLPEGRRIGYCERGPTNGKPVGISIGGHKINNFKTLAGHNMVRNIVAIIRIILLACIILFATVFLAISIYDSPEFGLRLLKYGQSDISDYLIFPERHIQNGDNVSFLERGDQAIPNTIFWYDPVINEERMESLDELFELTATNAFIVVRDDQIVYEGYFNGKTSDSIHTAFSASKSFASALIGAAIADDSIESIDDTVIKYVPEIAGRGLDALTIRDLLLMNSGIRYEYNSDLPFYKHPFGDDALTYYSPDLRRVALRVEADERPIGSAFHYNNYHLLLEGMILERSTGMTISEYLQEKIWKPMGAEYPASWSLDSERSGFEKMESGMNARAIDFARFGLIFLHDGYWNGSQIIPEEWVHASTEPLSPDIRDWDPIFQDFLSDGGYYKYHWAGYRIAESVYDFWAAGHYGQYIYIAPRKDVVIVRLGDQTDYPVEWRLTFRSIVDQMD